MHLLTAPRNVWPCAATCLPCALQHPPTAPATLRPSRTAPYQLHAPPLLPAAPYTPVALDRRHAPLHLHMPACACLPVCLPACIPPRPLIRAPHTKPHRCRLRCGHLRCYCLCPTVADAATCRRPCCTLWPAAARWSPPRPVRRAAYCRTRRTCRTPPRTSRPAARHPPR